MSPCWQARWFYREDFTERMNQALHDETMLRQPRCVRRLVDDN